MKVSIAFLSMLSLCSAQQHERGLLQSQLRNLRFQRVHYGTDYEEPKSQDIQALHRIHHNDPYRGKGKSSHSGKGSSSGKESYHGKGTMTGKGKSRRHHGLFSDDDSSAKGKGKGTYSSKGKGTDSGKGKMAKSEKGKMPTAAPSASFVPVSSFSPQPTATSFPTSSPTLLTIEATQPPVSETASQAPSLAIIEAEESSSPTLSVGEQATNAPSPIGDNGSSAPTLLPVIESDIPTTIGDDITSVPTTSVGDDSSTSPTFIPSPQPTAVGDDSTVQTSSSSESPSAIPLTTRSSSCINLGQGTWTSFSSIVGDQAGGNYGAAVSITDDASLFVIGGPNYDIGDGNGTLTGLADTYTITDGVVAFKDMIIGDRSASMVFGSSVAVSKDGNALAVAADQYIELLLFTDSVLETRIDTKAISEAVGQQVAISSDGSTIVTSGVDNNSVYVFRPNADKSALEQVGQTLTGSDGDLFGEAVDINGDGTVIVVGAKGGDYVSVFELNVDEWVQRGSSILPPPSSASDGFGNSVSINEIGDRVAVGTLVASESIGFVTIDDFDGSDWSRYDVIMGQDDDNLRDFGEIVKLSRDGTNLVVGSPYALGPFTKESPAGVVQVYRDAGIFCQQGDSIVGGLDGLRLGTSAAISSDGQIVALGGIGTAGKADSEIGMVNLYKFV